MKTRIQKYRRYRAKIEKMADKDFPNAPAQVEQSASDEEVLRQMAISEDAIAYKDLPLKSKKATPYYEYARQTKMWLGIKCASLALAVAGLICLYVFWVKGV